MALLLKKLIQGYFYGVNELRDPRTDGFYLISSPFQPLFLGAFYLMLVKKILPEFMKNRTPFKIDKIVIFFNITQVVLNCYIFYEGTIRVINLNWGCQPVDYSDTPANRKLLRIVYLYYCTKIADLLDTIFFILRGKNNQVSFLHVYHHFGMVCLTYVGVRYFGGGHSIFLGWVNAFVHSIMYFYYFITILKPEYKKKIWWKKYITQLQLAQFVFFVIIYGQLLLRPSCTFPKISAFVIVPQNLFMIVLFSDFYWKTYIKPKKHQKH